MNSTSEKQAAQRSTKLRMVGLIVLIVGLAAAATVYLVGEHTRKTADDLEMVGYFRGQTRQMESLYGKMGPMIDDLMDDLKQPGTQAIIIAAISGILSFGCFHFARPLESGADPEQ